MGVKIKYTLLSLFLIISIVVKGQSINTIQGHEYVDLGLSVLWATCNIGSNSPEEFGGYYAWGETYTKSSYNDITYKFAGETKASDNLNTIEAESNVLYDYTKYLGDHNKLNPNDVKLDIEDDVANVQWGNPWRMPSKNEISELVDSCDWLFGEIKGVKGCWAISKVNGNKIFFPLAGYVSDYIVLDIGVSGKYWASELRKDMCFEAYQIWISYADDWANMCNKSSVFLSNDGMRENGRSVRAVCEKHY